MRIKLLPLFLVGAILSLASGCLDHAFAGPCATISIPNGTEGSQFRYSGLGQIMTPSLDGALVSEKAFGGTNPDNVAKMAPGDSLTVAIADHSTQRLGLAGQEEPAVQATYWLYKNQSKLDMPMMDEWLNPVTGSDVQVSYRAFRVEPGAGAVHSIRMGRIEDPPLLIAPLFWGKTWKTGDSIDYRFLRDAGLPGNWKNDTLLFKVAVNPTPDKHCTLHAKGTWTLGVARPFTYSIDLSLRDDVPLPTTFKLSAITTSGGAQLQLQLDDSRIGSGDKLTPLQRTPSNQLPTGLPVATSTDGLIAETGHYWPTRFDEAAQAAHADATAGTWFNQHPTAVPASATHTLGDPSSKIVDEWIVLWTDGQGPALQTVIDRNPPPVVPLVPSNQFQVQTDPTKPNAPVPTWGAARISLDQLTQLHQQVYGGPAEVLECEADAGYCGIGTQNATGYPRAGTTGGGLTFPGLTVWADKGLVLQDISYDPTPLGDPVPQR